MNLFQEFEERKIDYNSVRVERRFPDEFLDFTVSVIIPVHGRTQFNNVISDAFERAIVWYNIKTNGGFTASVVYVEHSEREEHLELCEGWVNYFWIPQNGQRFNKCLCFNIGVLRGPKAKYYLFHDSDILVPENFFQILFDNMIGYDAVQAFSGQRLFHVGRELTHKILSGKFPVYELSITTSDVIPARSGAEGGSIFCTKEILIKTGLWPDWGFDQYSVEDSFMFRLLQLMGSVGFCNHPALNCYHLWHEPSFNRQTKQEDWNRYYAFMAMKEDGRKHMIKLMSDHFKKYYDEQA